MGTETDNCSKVNGVPRKKPFLIGVAGGTASGKVSKLEICKKKLMSHLQKRKNSEKIMTFYFFYFRALFVER